MKKILLILAMLMFAGCAYTVPNIEPIKPREYTCVDFFNETTAGKYNCKYFRTYNTVNSKELSKYIIKNSNVYTTEDSVFVGQKYWMLESNVNLVNFKDTSYFHKEKGVKWLTYEKSAQMENKYKYRVLESTILSTENYCKETFNNYNERLYCIKNPSVLFKFSDVKTVTIYKDTVLYDRSKAFMDLKTEKIIEEKTSNQFKVYRPDGTLKFSSELYSPEVFYFNGYCKSKDGMTNVKFVNDLSACE